ncbi:hypothetical protein USDA257_c07820 [Sinorhizobium fredii USDA 257]|uniref:PilZ domain-containing protein n=2 Tax=Sinorhizobium/Ensifer group TaxID=227292 RepID=I3X0G9_SINF2|nr:hypothetical protein USDA257_c07820 [Sinorhizobium fredii USDA 257]
MTGFSAKRTTFDTKLAHAVPLNVRFSGGEDRYFPDPTMSMIMHLAQGKPGQSAVAYPHYHIERRCRILVIGSQLKATTRYRALLRHISIGGAMLDFNAAILLPKHFFLEVDGFKEEIGCAEVHRSGPELGRAIQHAAGAGFPEQADSCPVLERVVGRARPYSKAGWRSLDFY